MNECKAGGEKVVKNAQSKASFSFSHVCLCVVNNLTIKSGN